jgi:hypothetical protein
MNHAFLNNKAARVAAFALATGVSTVSYAQNTEAPATPEAEIYATKGESYATLAKTINALANKPVTAKESSRISSTIILTPGISPDETKKLVNLYNEKIGNAPAYLSALAQDNEDLAACKLVYLNLTRPRTEETAQAISNCTTIVGKVTAQKTASTSAEPQQHKAKVDPKPVAQPPVQTPSVIAKVETQPVVKTEASGHILGLSYPVAAGIGGGVLVAAFLIGALARRKNTSEPSPSTPTVTSTPKPEATPLDTPAPTAKPKKKSDDFTL